MKRPFDFRHLEQVETCTSTSLSISISLLQRCSTPLGSHLLLHSRRRRRRRPLRLPCTPAASGRHSTPHGVALLGEMCAHPEHVSSCSDVLVLKRFRIPGPIPLDDSQMTPMRVLILPNCTQRASQSPEWYSNHCDYVLATWRGTHCPRGRSWDGHLLYP